MPDDFGRVNPVSPHFLDRDAQGEPYQGRHPRKHQNPSQDSTDVYLNETMEEGTEAAGASAHIDLRI